MDLETHGKILCFIQALRRLVEEMESARQNEKICDWLAKCEVTELDLLDCALRAKEMRDRVWSEERGVFGCEGVPLHRF